MATAGRQDTRADRLRAYEGVLDVARDSAATFGLLVRAYEDRAAGREPAEVRFAQTTVDDRALPAGVWVALRRDDPAGAVEAMCAVSLEQFLVDEREEMGEGYRLQTVAETRPRPEVELLISQLSLMLDIPRDVVAMLADWGVEDPRTQPEIDELLDARLSAARDRRPVPAGDGLVMTVAETVDVLQLSEAQAKVLATLVRRVGVTITP